MVAFAVVFAVLSVGCYGLLLREAVSASRYRAEVRTRLDAVTAPPFYTLDGEGPAVVVDDGAVPVVAPVGELDW